MLKVLLWFVSKDAYYLETALDILERQHGGLDIVGTATGDKIVEFDCRACDVMLVVGAKQIGMSEVVKFARQLNLPEEKLLGDWIVCVPGFTLDKYRKLQRSRLSIFAMNCFGGLISHTLGLPFRSPFVNIFFREKDFLNFLRAPQAYMDETPILKETLWEQNLKRDYPVVMLGDVEIHMNHYRDFDEAVDARNRRKARINWYNLFVTAYTESEEFLQEFDALPFGKKVCFVPFESDADSAWYINPEIKRGLEFWDIVNHFGIGDPFYYDPFDMLLYGKKTPLIEM